MNSESECLNDVGLIGRVDAVLAAAIGAAENVEMLRRVMGRLLKDEATRSAMRHALLENPPEDGAGFLARWVGEGLG